MKRILAVCLAMTLLLSASLALAQDDTEITVQGTATVKAEPDMVSVTANASVDAGTVAGAQEKMNAIVTEVTAKLIELGVKEEDIVTQHYAYYPNYHYEGDVRTLAGYQANHTLNITCRDVEMLDGVIGVITDVGMSEIYGIRYDALNRAALYQEALAMAIEATRSKAETMARAGGLAVTSLEELRENGGYDAGVSVNAVEDAMMSVRAESGTGIRAGSVSVTANVTAVYKAEAK